jgi:hypothetical protein
LKGRHHVVYTWRWVNGEAGVLQQLDNEQRDRRGKRGAGGELREGAMEDRERA